MPRFRAWRLLLLFAPFHAQAQIFVFPRRAQQSHVVYTQFEWRQIDILIGSDGEKELSQTEFHAPYAERLTEKTGGVRLYFYEKERVIAEQAAASITDSYRKLVKRFRYVPTETFPYILYNAYQEFLQTNLFPVQEGVLGVTSPVDLKLTLPYMGDHALFHAVSTHELVHQFTIQKLKTLAKEKGASGSPIENLPLWFIEGLAEYYAHDGIPGEAEMVVRDILLNPDLQMGFAMLDFFEDRPFSVLWTYKAGNVRCAFLEETYGSGFLQRVLEGTLESSPNGEPPSAPSFSALMQRLTQDEPKTISQKFEVWIKRRAFQTYLNTAQDLPQLRALGDGSSPQRLVTTFASSPDGKVVLYRSLNADTGGARLWLMNQSRPEFPSLVASDGGPGLESLHPIEGRNFDLSQTHIAFIAESKSQDSVFIEEFNASLRRRNRRRIDIRPHGLLAAFSPSFSPDGRELAFIGMNEEGVRDIYIVSLDQIETLRKITDSPFTKRHLSWGPSGIVFTSDSTPHRHFNVFWVSPSMPFVVKQLTNEERDHESVKAFPDGRIFFVAWENAKAHLYELLNDQTLQRTDVATGVFEPHPAPQGDIYVLIYRSGMRRLMLLPQSALLSLPPRVQLADGPVQPIARLSLDGSQPYETFARKNWDLGPIMGIAGGGAGGVVGQFMGSARDRLNNHALVLRLGIFGSWELIDGYLLYLNQERRTTFGTGLFQSLRFRQDKTFTDFPFRFFSGERYFGALGSIRYPFHRFAYVQADGSFGGASYFLFRNDQRFLSTPELNTTDRNWYPDWEAANSGVRMQTEGTLRLGFDTTKAHFATGPISGSSGLLEGTITWQPVNSLTYANVRLDVEHYIGLGGRTNFFLRGGSGLTTGGLLAREFFLSSFDTLRGVRFGDADRLLGRNYFFSTAELQFPLNAFMRVFLFTDLEGILGVDFGGVGRDFEDAFDRRVFNGVLGLNMGLGPFVFRLHFARNFDVNSPYGLPVGRNEWVTNFSLGIAGLGGPLFSKNTRVGAAAR